MTSYLCQKPNNLMYQSVIEKNRWHKMVTAFTTFSSKSSSGWFFSFRFCSKSSSNYTCTIIPHDVSLQESNNDTKLQLNECQVTYFHKSQIMQRMFPPRTRRSSFSAQTHAMKDHSKCHSGINPPFIYQMCSCADLQPSKATCVISSLWLGCSWGVDMLASQRVEERKRAGWWNGDMSWEELREG